MESLRRALTVSAAPATTPMPTCAPRMVLWLAAPWKSGGSNLVFRR
jgi:hypothetical protein